MATPSSAGSGRSSLTSNRSCIESDLHLLPVSCSVRMIYGQKKRGQTRKVLVKKKKKVFWKPFLGQKSPSVQHRTHLKILLFFSICRYYLGDSCHKSVALVSLCLSFYLFCHFFVTKRKVGLTKNNGMGMFTGGGASGKQPAAARRVV